MKLAAAAVLDNGGSMTFSCDGVAQIDGIDWRDRFRRVVQQESLILTAPSLPAVRELVEPPQLVYLGVGLCTRHHLSEGLPVDVLGLILPAEAIRRALGAAQLLVLVADAHASTNHLPPDQIERRARRTVQALARVARRFALSRMVVVRASTFDSLDEFSGLLRAIETASDGRHHSYVLRQVADVAYLSRRCGPLVKVGWMLGRALMRRGATDELMFDRLVAPLSDASAAYVYCRPGRALDDERGRAPPYIVRDVTRRVLLDHREDVARKLEAAAASPLAVRAVKNHLRRITATYARTVAPLSAPTVEARTQNMLDRLFRPAVRARAR